ncbi:hypothetical protein WOLCODRAFT_146586 [Wolfiporia cocos MD-104 SS10]|uniref:Uncharacterized protein n=1 Tax=Wolfiporia cocos (strain MD-104) TaxID=742152 RepID=A0A2H3J4R9_WOLCO|nr:hypothetical protein WOLCODRAFT_146586 [Wolfiporia cocos MD-104 SS10]
MVPSSSRSQRRKGPPQQKKGTAPMPPRKGPLARMAEEEARGSPSLGAEDGASQRAEDEEESEGDRRARLCVGACGAVRGSSVRWRNTGVSGGRARRRRRRRMRSTRPSHRSRTRSFGHDPAPRAAPAILTLRRRLRAQPAWSAERGMEPAAHAAQDVQGCRTDCDRCSITEDAEQGGAALGVGRVRCRRTGRAVGAVGAGAYLPARLSAVLGD